MKYEDQGNKIYRLASETDHNSLNILGRVSRLTTGVTFHELSDQFYLILQQTIALPRKRKHMIARNEYRELSR